MTGTAGQLRVPVNFVKEVSLPLAPLPEQRLIVARVETLLERVRKAKEMLEKVPQIMKRFRQAVLKKAFSGELTAEWRAQQQNLESATKLLKRIQEEREKRYHKEVRKTGIVGEGRPPKRPKYLQMEPLDTSDLSELPEGWVWTTTNQLFSFVTSGSRGWAKYYAEKGALFIRVGNLNRDTIALDLSEQAYVCPPNNAEGTRTMVQPNDILISITADVGMVAVVPEGIGEAYINQHVALARPESGIWSKFLGYFLASENGGQQQFRDLQYGATKVGLGLDDLRNVHVYFPPLSEQHEIVRRINSLFKFADEVEKRVEEARKRVDQMTESILSRAFCGELTVDFREAAKNWKSLDLEERKKYTCTLPEEEQEKALYSDEFLLEPADRLLERIREERAKRDTNSTRAGGRKREAQQLKLIER